MRPTARRPCRPNQQFQQLKADINQVSQTAKFNGVNLLDGSFQGATFQIGANAGQTITVASVASSATTNLGQLYSQASTRCDGRCLRRAERRQRRFRHDHDHHRSDRQSGGLPPR